MPSLLLNAYRELRKIQLLEVKTRPLPTLEQCKHATLQMVNDITQKIDEVQALLERRANGETAVFNESEGQ